MGERKLSGTVLYKEGGLIPPSAPMTMIKVSSAQVNSFECYHFWVVNNTIITLFQVLLGYVSVVIQKAEWSCIKMANGEHYVVIIGRLRTIIISWWFI